MDRCSEDTIVEFFKALNLILPIEGIVLVLAVNYKSVCYALANNNRHYFDSEISNIEKIKFGLEYLDKYINIPFYIPNKTNYEKYIRHLLDVEEKVIKKQINKENRKLKKQNLEVRSSEKRYNEKLTFTAEENRIIEILLSKVNTILYLTPRDIKK